MDTRTKKSQQKALTGALAAREFSRPRLIVIEDDPDVREALRLLLDGKYEVVGFPDGDDILAAIDNYEPGLVILDVDLPGKNGFELCRQIRQSSKHRRLPVLFLTVHRDDESFVRNLQVNADAYLTKPFEAAELKETIRRLVTA